MIIKKYKYGIANKWSGDATREIVRAVKYFKRQSDKGRTLSQCIEQTENQYGYMVGKTVCDSFLRVLTKEYEQ